MPSSRAQVLDQSRQVRIFMLRKETKDLDVDNMRCSPINAKTNKVGVGRQAVTVSGKPKPLLYQLQEL